MQVGTPVAVWGKQMPFPDRLVDPMVADDDEHHVAHRHKFFELTILWNNAGEARAHLINISITGALVHIVNPPDPGSAVRIELGKTPVGTCVVWRNGAKFGITFCSLFTEATIDLLLRA